MNQHFFEKRPERLTLLHKLLGNSSEITTQISEDDLPMCPPLYALAWGWNTGGESGNITEISVYKPKQIQKSVLSSYISSSAGTASMDDYIFAELL
jgi:hypothetical protein